MVPWYQYEDCMKITILNLIPEVALVGFTVKCLIIYFFYHLCLAVKIKIKIYNLKLNKIMKLLCLTASFRFLALEAHIFHNF
jgi:hypothetical protein